MAYQLTIGSITVSSISDARRTSPLSRIFPEVSAEDWERFRPLYPDSFGDGPTWFNNFGVFLVEGPAGVVLVDAGVGAGPVDALGGARGRLLDELAAIDHSPADLDHVVITHLHFDHTGWLVDDAGRPRFANARHLIHREEWKHWTAGEQQPHIARLKSLEQNGKLELFDDDHPVMTGVRIRQVHGHTPGHVVVEVEDGGGYAVIVGDLTHHPAQVTMPSWCARVDVDKDRSRQWREQLLAEVADRDGIWACGHFPPPSVGKIGTHQGTRRWEPCG